MDDEFDLYGDADIYGSGEPPKVEDSKEDFQPGTAAARAPDTNGDPGAGSKRGRDDEMGNDVKPQQAPAGLTSSSGSSQAASDPMRGVTGQQDGPRPLDEPIDPSSARMALAGRPKVTDPSVQNALYVGELDWWVSDEDIRRIANDLGIPIQISDVTFSEHKVNGKSKGICFVETASEDEANNLKAWFENNDLNFKRPSVNLSTSASGNPFKTLPKDPPPREARAPRGTMRGAMAMGARENNRGGGPGGGSGGFPMAGAPIRMGGNGGNGPQGGMPMMNPMMMGMMGGGGRGGFGNPMAFMGGGRGGGGGSGYGGRGRGQGHFNPNFFGGNMGGGGRGGPPQGGPPDDRERKRYRADEGGY